MIKAVLCCISIFAFVTAVVPDRAGAQAARNKQVSRSSTCEARIQKLATSPAEGVERLTEKEQAIERCACEYKRDKTIVGLVNECKKYLEQPVVKQQAVAECELAAFNYANELRSLKAWYRK